MYRLNKYVLSILQGLLSTSWRVFAAFGSADRHDEAAIAFRLSFLVWLSEVLSRNFKSQLVRIASTTPSFGCFH